TAGPVAGFEAAPGRSARRAVVAGVVRDSQRRSALRGVALDDVAAGVAELDVLTTAGDERESADSERRKKSGEPHVRWPPALLHHRRGTSAITDSTPARADGGSNERGSPAPTSTSTTSARASATSAWSTTAAPAASPVGSTSTTASPTP